MTKRMKQIGERLKRFREAAMLSQEDVAKVLNVTQAAVSNYERGYRAPDLDQLFLLSTALGRSTSDLIGLENDLTPEEDHLLAIFRSLPPELRRAVLRAAEAMK